MMRERATRRSLLVQSRQRRSDFTRASSSSTSVSIALGNISSMMKSFSS